MENITVTGIIIAITCLISYKAFNDQGFFRSNMHHPYSEHQHKEYHRLLSSGFLHGSLMHLLLNMYVLYEFGSVVERLFILEFGLVGGRSAYIAMYILTIVAANLYTHFKHKDWSGYSAIGASGAVSGILFSYVIFYPWSMLGIFFVIPCPAIVFAVLYLVYSSWASKNSNDNIGHDAHFWGAVFGMAFTFVLKPSLIMSFLERLSNLPGF